MGAFTLNHGENLWVLEDRRGCMECGFGRGGVRRDAGIAGDDFMLKEAVDKKSLENIRILYEGSFPE